jgi:hypothetical protein
MIISILALLHQGGFATFCPKIAVSQASTSCGIDDIRLLQFASYEQGPLDMGRV